LWIALTILVHKRFSKPEAEKPKEYPHSPATSTRELWKQEDLRENYGTYKLGND